MDTSIEVPHESAKADVSKEFKEMLIPTKPDSEKVTPGN